MIVGYCLASSGNDKGFQLLIITIFSSFVLMKFISRVYMPLVDNKSLSSLVRELMSILNFIIFGLQGKALKNFTDEYFL